MIGKPAIVLVAAVARNGVIGGGNKLLWRLSSDMQRFKAVTMGKPLVMGRKTFESIGRALPGRETIVITRDNSYAPAGVHVVHDLARALDVAAERAQAMGAREVIIAGGGDVYAQVMDIADRLVITHVDLAPQGDTFFPRINPEIWREISREPHEKGLKDESAFVFSIYERRRKPAGAVEMRGKGA